MALFGMPTYSPRVGTLIVALALAGLTVAACGRSSTGPRFGDEAVVDGVRYDGATTQVAASDPLTLRTTLRATNTSGETRTIEVGGGCPVSVVVYQSAMRTGTPVFDQAADAACAASLMQVVLAPGESRTLNGTVTGAEIRRGTLPLGRYYFGAVVRPNGHLVTLAAGDAELSD